MGRSQNRPMRLNRANSWWYTTSTVSSCSNILHPKPYPRISRCKVPHPRVLRYKGGMGRARLTWFPSIFTAKSVFPIVVFTSVVQASSTGAKMVKPFSVSASSCCAPPAEPSALARTGRPDVERDVVGMVNASDNFGGNGTICVRISRVLYIEYCMWEE